MSDMSSRNIVIVDDDEAIRHSASFMLRHAGFRVKTYPDGISFLNEVADIDQACILLDVRMPEMDGLTVLQKLRDDGYGMPVIVLTGHGDVSTAVSAMKAGATDFLEKPYEKASLLDAMNAAFDKMDRGEQEVSLRQAAEARLNALTARERDVLERLVEGRTNKAIATDLDISARTVEIHRANLMTKLEADSLSAVLKIAFSAGLAG